MNNFPVEPPADLFGNGLLGSYYGLFETQLNFISDIPSTCGVQPHPAFCMDELPNDFGSMATGLCDVPLDITCEPAMTIVTQPEASVSGISDSDAVDLVDKTAAAATPDDSACQSEDAKPVIDSSVNSGSADDSKEGVASDNRAADVVNCNATELLGGQPAVSCKTEPSEISDDPVIDISISNVVCAFNTKCYLSLKTIAREGVNVEYKKATGTVLMKLRKPMVTANIWASGKVTCTGSRSEEEARVAARRVGRCLQKIYKNAKFTEFRVVNVLGNCSLPFGIRITEFSRCYPKEASYEPEIHPGVTYRIETPKATLKIFSTGSITVTAPRIINVQRAVEHIYPLVVKFRMDRCKEELPEVHSSSAFRHQFSLQQPWSLHRPDDLCSKAKRQRIDNESSDASEDFSDNKRW